MGRLKYFLHNWKLLTSDQYTLSTVRLQSRVSRESQIVKAALLIQLNPSQLALVEDQIASLLDKKAIVSVPRHRKLFYSNLFLWKRNGKGDAL